MQTLSYDLDACSNQCWAWHWPSKPDPTWHHYLAPHLYSWTAEPWNIEEDVGITSVTVHSRSQNHEIRWIRWRWMMNYDEWWMMNEWILANHCYKFHSCRRSAIASQGHPIDLVPKWQPPRPTGLTGAEGLERQVCLVSISTQLGTISLKQLRRYMYI